jgi:ABC-2 type transport system ATP-binding protein
MAALLDDVVADHELHANSDATRRARAEREDLYARNRDMAPSKPGAFVAENLGKTYQRSGFSLRGVNLTLRQGEITGVLGENGQGKTTLFRLAAGELKPDSGTLRYPVVAGHGSRTNWIRVYEHLAYVPQELASWHGSLEDNLRYEAAIHRITGAANDREVEYIVERLGLREHLDKRWSELSGGFKLRFALAKALVWKPAVLLLDEPLANLDINAQQIVLTDIRDLSTSLRYPMAVLLSSQHLHEVEAVSTNLLFLGKGTVKYYGPVSDIGLSRHVNTFRNWLAGRAQRHSPRPLFGPVREHLS